MNGPFCAVIVAFNPDAEFWQRIALLAGSVEAIFVVDNGSAHLLDAWEAPRLVAHLEILPLGTNKGIAAALNVGIRRAIDMGYAWVLTLDQDTAVAPEMVQAMAAASLRAKDPGRVCIVAPRVINRGMGTETLYLRRHLGPFYRRSRCEGETLEDVTTVITSGSLVNLEAFRELGGFRDDFFIDYVDTEFCLRALSHGYHIIVACGARLEHQLGRRTKASLGPLALYPTHHSPGRWYYMSRNRIPMIRRYGLRFPHWLSYEIVASSYVMLRMLLTEDERREKLKAFLRGTWDGLRGRMGPMPGSPEAAPAGEPPANG